MAEAEAMRDVQALARDASPEATAALGRLADGSPSDVASGGGAARAELEKRATTDVNAYIAAWTAVTRKAPWGTAFVRDALGNPARADVAATALPRGEPRLIPFVPDLEGAVERLSAGHRGSIVAGVLASVGPEAHAHVERRLLDPKTRGAMCDGIGLPEASPDAKSLVLKVPADARNHASCVDVVLVMAATDDAVLDWVAQSAEPGLVSAAAKSTLACSRLSAIWAKGLTSRAAETHAALAVPLQLSLQRCAPVLDPVVAHLLSTAPRARSVILQAIDAYSTEMADLALTCKALREGWVAGESARIRERAGDALANGCRFAVGRR